MLRLKDEAGQKGFSPTQPSEKMIFLYAYLGSGYTEKALELSREISTTDTAYNQMICKIWEKSISSDDPGLMDTFNILKKKFTC